jgi:hypothetical protein
MRHNKFVTNKRGEEMMSWLPWYYKDSQIMNEIINAQSEEIVAAREIILYVLAQFYVDTADDFGLGLWEKELGLTPAEGASKDLRRAQIKAKLQRPPIMTPLQIQSIVNLFINGKTAKVMECPGTYHFRIDIPFGDLIWRAEMLEAVEEAKPAHLGFHIRYTLINGELDDTVEIGDDTDEADFIVSSAIRYEDYIPYGGGIKAAKYDGNLQYGGGQYYNGDHRHDGEISFIGIAADTPQFGAGLPYHFRYDGLAALIGEYRFNGAIRYDGYRPYKLEYDDFIDELGVFDIRIGKDGEPAFEDNVDTALSYDGIGQFAGDAEYGAGASPIDVSGDIAIRRFRRFDGAIDCSGGDINIFDGSMTCDGLFDFDGGGNRYRTATYTDRIGGQFSIRRPRKGTPFIYRYPEFEDLIPATADDLTIRIIQQEIQEDLPLSIGFDGGIFYNGIPASENSTVIDVGGRVRTERARHADGSIRYGDFDAQKADGSLSYGGAKPYEGGENHAITIRQNRSL